MVIYKVYSLFIWQTLKKPPWHLEELFIPFLIRTHLFSHFLLQTQMELHLPFQPVNKREAWMSVITAKSSTAAFAKILPD